IGSRVALLRSSDGKHALLKRPSLCLFEFDNPIAECRPQPACHPAFLVQIMCSCDRHTRMPQRTGCRVDAVPVAHLAAVLLAQRVERLASGDAVRPEPCVEPIKAWPAPVIIVPGRYLCWQVRFDYKIAVRPGSHSAKDFYYFGFEVDRTKRIFALRLEPTGRPNC